MYNFMKYCFFAALTASFVGGFIWGSTVTWNAEIADIVGWIFFRVIIPGVMGAAAAGLVNMLVGVAFEVAERCSKCREV